MEYIYEPAPMGECHGTSRGTDQFYIPSFGARVENFRRQAALAYPPQHAQHLSPEGYIAMTLNSQLQPAPYNMYTNAPVAVQDFQQHEFEQRSAPIPNDIVFHNEPGHIDNKSLKSWIPSEYIGSDPIIDPRIPVDVLTKLLWSYKLQTHIRWDRIESLSITSYGAVADFTGRMTIWEVGITGGTKRDTSHLRMQKFYVCNNPLIPRCPQVVFIPQPNLVINTLKLDEGSKQPESPESAGNIN